MSNLFIYIQLSREGIDYRKVKFEKNIIKKNKMNNKLKFSEVKLNNFHIIIFSCLH
jgi:hypothetical protein